MTRSEIIKALRENQKRIEDIICTFENNDSIDRRSQTKIVFTLFKLIDSMCKVEIGIYNYLKKRGWK